MNIVFLSYFLKVQTFNSFHFIIIFFFCIQITSSFQLLYLIYFFVQYFLRYLFCLVVSSVSRSFEIFFKKIMWVFLPSLFLFLRLNFHFKSLLNQFLCLKNVQHLQEYCFFLSHFLEVQIHNLFYFICIFCIQITNSFQLFCLIYFFVQYFF